MSVSKGNPGRAVPWWLSEDNETCFACNHQYAHRTEIYCFDCDAAICPICVVRTSTTELICPGCSDSRSTEEV